MDGDSSTKPTNNLLHPITCPSTFKHWEVRSHKASHKLLLTYLLHKQQLFLLGHLNLAIQIISQGWSDFPRLLSLGPHTITSNTVTLNSSSKAEMCLWKNLMANWNDITIFYKDQLSNPRNIQLFTDAVPSASSKPYGHPSSFKNLFRHLRQF